MLALSPAESSRLNTVYVTAVFAGGSVGSAAASMLWAHDGWHAGASTATVTAALALTAWAIGRRGPLACVPPTRTLPTPTKTQHRPSMIS